MTSFFHLVLLLALSYQAIAAPSVKALPKAPVNAPSSVNDASALYDALHSSDGPNTDDVMNILARITLEERLELVDAYQIYYEIDLLTDLQDKLSGDFETVIVALVTPLPEFYASQLNTAVVGLGTDEADLVEILITLSNSLIEETSSIYYSKYEETLEAAIIDDTDGFFSDFLVELSHAGRDENPNVDEDAAYTDGQALFKATNETIFDTINDIFSHRSFPQIDAVLDYYEILSGQDIETLIEDNFSGDIKDGLTAVVDKVNNEPGYYARRLHEAFEGLGTSDNDLVRIIVTRSDVDITEIRAQYETLYSTSLADDIIGETSGDYQKCLLILIGESKILKTTL